MVIRIAPGFTKLRLHAQLPEKEAEFVGDVFYLFAGWFTAGMTGMGVVVEQYGTLRQCK